MMTEMNDLQPILQRLAIKELNEMQIASIGAIDGRKDVVLLSPTGSGKTLAYLLPILRRLKTEQKGLVQVMVIAPSRELALQIDTVFKDMHTSFKSVCCYGGKPTMDEKRTIVGTQPEVIIGTPGRLNDHLGKGNFSVNEVHTLVLDEFDKSLEFGFQAEMEEVLAYLEHLDKRILLSATDLQHIPAFVGMGRITRLDFLKGEEKSRLHMMQVDSPIKDKLETLYQLLCTLGSSSTVVFCNFRESVDRIADYLQSRQFYCEAFHGGMEQDQREKSIYKFRSGSCHVLISTDLAARGLDIPEIENVVHYHLPTVMDAFIHRNGRTARWEEEGNAFIILNAEEIRPDYLPTKLEKRVLPKGELKPTQPAWSTLYIAKGKRDKLNKIDVVGFLYKVAQLKREEVGRIDVRDRYAFVAIKREKLKETLRLIQGEKIKGKRVLIEEAK